MRCNVLAGDGVFEFLEREFHERRRRRAAGFAVYLADERPDH